MAVTYGGELLFLRIWRDHSARSAHISLPRDSARDNLYAVQETHARTKLLGGLNYEKIRRYNNPPPYVTARWPPQQIHLVVVDSSIIFADIVHVTSAIIIGYLGPSLGSYTTAPKPFLRII